MLYYNAITLTDFVAADACFFFLKKTSRSRSIVYWPIRLLDIHSFKLVVLNNIYEYKYEYNGII